MRRTCGIALMLAIVVLAASAAPAPDVRPLGGIVNGLLLLRDLGNLQMQEELKLTESQVKQIKELRAESLQSPTVSPSRGLTREEKIRKWQEDGKAKVEAVTKILTQKQFRRVEQIYLQRFGPMTALRIPSVATVIKLTEEQKEKMNLIRQEASKAYQESRTKGERKPYNEFMKKGDEKLLNELTPMQRRKWEELLGQPFKLKPRSPRGNE